MNGLAVVVWKWSPPAGFGVRYTAKHVNRLAEAVAEHYPELRRFVCVTDDARGLAPWIVALPDWRDFAAVPSPHGAHMPSCYRRLRAFHPEAGRWFGERFVCLDLDVLPVGELAALWHRSEDFVIYRDPHRPAQYNGSAFVLTAGARPEVWTDFAPTRSRRLAREAGKYGSDQGWISYRLEGEATWGPGDGVHSWRFELAKAGGELPPGARLVVFHGRPKPWEAEAQALPWVRKNWGPDRGPELAGLEGPGRA